MPQKNALSGEPVSIQNWYCQKSKNQAG